MARLLSLNVGMPRDVAWSDRTVHTGIFKYPVDGPRMVRRLNVDGDGQGDLGGHGGEIRAVLVYQRESYDFWRAHLHRDDLEYGQFGENFTVDGLPDDEVNIGDRYRVGEAEFEVTQPRVTCFRVGMRLGEPRMPSLLVAHHRPGFYLRVITEGRVQAGDEIVRTRQGPHRMSVAAVDALLYLPDRDVEDLRRALDISALSPGWQGSFRDLLAGPRATVETWQGFRPLRVSRVVPESTTVTSIYLSGDGPLPRPRPGQYLTLRTPGTPQPVRSYSLSATPSDTEYRISVKRDGVVSTFLHTGLAVGASLEVAAPRGEFFLAEDETTPVLLLSAGIGVTPVLAMLHTLAAAGSRREVWWLHTTRSAGTHAFAAEAHDLLATLPHGHEHVHYTATEGRLGAETLAALDLPPDTTAYLCGPDAFMTAMRDALVAAGLNRANVHSELFGALPSLNPGVVGASRTPPHAPEGRVGTGPSVTFARSGLTIPWREDFRSLLELAEACDVPTRWSCRTGVCHNCVTPVLSGDLGYDPDPLEPPAPGDTLICCSHPETDLVLDL
ncbi:MOSC and FAD-binding oxidoreductase domain-containing protein [Actinophytocola oryzae]|uniref:Ferredoxin-NADP reductase n=1 Tax=Actinophytocola oryzae TaxID=502181 RepID=A0A4R7W6M3_9PSEU|nr:MOSC and FAD-binding oxidoreductase domain-containing protein [Actinophytocola oryzae]TDV57337.1 ferredoxin-NADP reductase [Actinophytocola oryzae]